MLPYISVTQDDKEKMLKKIGVKSIEELYETVPQDCRLNRELDIPKLKSEIELKEYMNHLSKKNKDIENNICFLGAGAYDHYIPSVVDHIVSRQEFYTAYTPYQPEISQGTLQGIFEYQSYICELTGMEVSNASMYDGATAMAEACIMACSKTRKNKVIVSKTVHPECRKVLKTYARYRDIQILEINYVDGLTDLSWIESNLSKDIGAVVIQTPNFFGLIEDYSNIVEKIHNNKSLLITYVDPISLAILKSPGKVGADIVVGEGQSLGTPLSFGGPYLGFIAATKNLMRKMPGRIVGETVDKDGKKGYVLTLQAREQHIRREKATSNICSNQALIALRATIYLSALGKKGFSNIAQLCLQKSNYAKAKLCSLKGISKGFNGMHIKEFVVKIDSSIEKINKNLLKHNMIGGYNLEKDYPELKGYYLISVTEKRTKEQIDKFIEKVGEAINE